MVETPLLAALRDLVGADHVLPGGDLPAHEIDWRKRYRGRALAVVRPGSTEAVAAVVRACAAHGVPIVPQGGNTGLVGGGVPDDSGTQVVLWLGRLNRIRQIDPDNLTLTAEAGCVLHTVQEAARGAGLLFPLSLAAEGSCTIGGNLATNAGGTQVLSYGTMRELCLGLEAVTPQGEIWHGLSGLRKDNTGYDLRHLLIGSEGTLGIITAATLKLYPAPRAQLTALAACEDLPQAQQLLNLARARAGDSLTAFEVMNHTALNLVQQHFPAQVNPLTAEVGTPPWTVLIELSDARDEAQARERLESLLSEALEQGCVQDAALAQSLAQAQAFWHLRESIPLAQSQEGLNIKHDIALPVSAVPGFVAATEPALQALCPGVRVVNFGHLGDGNLHFNVQAPLGRDAAEFLATMEAQVNGLVYDAVTARGGSISAEHGIGRLKRNELQQRQDPAARQMMRAIKAALDPQGLLNPGKVL